MSNKEKTSNLLEKERFPTPARYQKNKFIRRIFKSNPSLKKLYFLDLCGPGEILTILDEFGMKGEGIDLSEKSVKLAAERVSGNIKVYQKDFMAIKNKKYELIMMLDILEHIKDDDSFVKQINKVLKPEGYCLINVPAKMKLYGNHDIYFGHYRRYEREELKNLLEKNGFKILEFWSYGFKILNNLYSFLLKNKVKDNKAKNTEESGYKTAGFMEKIYPIFKYFYGIMLIQYLTRNTNMGTQYLVLCKKKSFNNS